MTAHVLCNDETVVLRFIVSVSGLYQPDPIDNPFTYEYAIRLKGKERSMFVRAMDVDEANRCRNALIEKLQNQR